MTKTPRGMNEAPREYKLEDTAFKFKKIGNSVGVILPKEFLHGSISRRATSSIRSSNRMAVCGFRHSIPKHATDDGNRPRGHGRYRDTFAALAK